MPVDIARHRRTNRDLEREVEAGRFREDLFYRLNVVHLVVPPLRDRRGDIPVLVDHLVDRLNTKLGTRCLGVERDALWSLIGRPWKGNVRELENVLERAIVLGGSDLISLRDLSAEPVTGQGSPPQDLRGAVRRFERQHLKEVLATTQSTSARRPVCWGSAWPRSTASSAARKTRLRRRSRSSERANEALERGRRLQTD